MPVIENTTSSHTCSDVVLENFKDTRYRHAIVDSYVRETIAFQLKAMRDALGLTQGEMAQRLGNGKLQPVVSRYESPDYGRYSLTTLKKLARLFDVALVVRFEAFSKLIKWHRELQDEGLAVPSFNAELLSGAFRERRPTLRRGRRSGALCLIQAASQMDLPLGGILNAEAMISPASMAQESIAISEQVPSGNQDNSGANYSAEIGVPGPGVPPLDKGYMQFNAAA